MMVFRVLLASAWLDLLLVPALPAMAGDTPRYHFVEHGWDRYRATYAGDHPAVVVEKKVEAEVKKDFSSKITKSIIMAVFDVDHAGDVLNYQETVPPHLDVKKIRAWSVERASGELSWAESDDIHEEKRWNGFTDLRIAIPGFADQGICGIEIELKGRGLQDQDFMSSMPVIEAEYRVLHKGGAISFMDIQVRGPVEEIPAQRTGDGILWIWRALHLPPRTPSPIRSVPNARRAELIWIPFWWSWASWAKGLHPVEHEEPSGDRKLCETPA